MKPFLHLLGGEGFDHWAGRGGSGENRAGLHLLQQLEHLRRLQNRLPALIAALQAMEASRSSTAWGTGLKRIGSGWSAPEPVEDLAAQQRPWIDMTDQRRSGLDHVGGLAECSAWIPRAATASPWRSKVSICAGLSSTVAEKQGLPGNPGGLMTLEQLPVEQPFSRMLINNNQLAVPFTKQVEGKQLADQGQTAISACGSRHKHGSARRLLRPESVRQRVRRWLLVADTGRIGETDRTAVGRGAGDDAGSAVVSEAVAVNAWGLRAEGWQRLEAERSERTTRAWLAQPAGQVQGESQGEAHYSVQGGIRDAAQARQRHWSDMLSDVAGTADRTRSAINRWTVSLLRKRISRLAGWTLTST